MNHTNFSFLLITLIELFMYLLDEPEKFNSIVYKATLIVSLDLDG